MLEAKLNCSPTDDLTLTINSAQEPRFCTRSGMQLYACFIYLQFFSKLKAALISERYQTLDIHDAKYNKDVF